VNKDAKKGFLDKESTVGAWWSERGTRPSSKTRRMEIFERSMGLKMTRPCDRDRWTVERKSPEKRDLEMVERRAEVMGIVFKCRL